MYEMPVKTYLKNKHKKLESQYQQVAKQFESTYGLIQDKVNSRLHREKIEIEVIRNKLNSLVQKSIVPTTSTTNPPKNNPILERPSTKNLYNFYKENIDWTRGRFSGETVQIVVRKGQIIEKVFLTAKGTRISVKRSELGLIARFSRKS
tara:strand:- start:388 stop:834 length:447 start_codon:yes stop_codon:yes gene_type:complete